jgi:replication factor A1
MGVIEDIYADLDTDEVSEEEFREAVESKVEQMGGLADEETAAMLIAHELDEREVEGVADVQPGMEEVKFVAKVVGVGDLRSFERDDEEEDGQVVNVEVADETGSIRVTFWDEQAGHAVEHVEVGDDLRIAGRPRDGYNGVEVNVSRAEPAEDANVDVQVKDTYDVADLSLGLSDVNLRGRVLETTEIRTFDRDDGSEGRVANLSVGDETGRVRVTLWDDRTAHAAEFEGGDCVEVVDGYVRERDGALELHVGDRGKVVDVEETIEFEPDTADIDGLEIGETVDIAGVVRSADPIRTFDRDDGSEGQVRNVRVQDGTGDIRVALWGEKADADLGPGDEVVLTDVEIQDGWQDDVEASASWRSSVVPMVGDANLGGSIDADASASGDDAGDDGGGTGLGAFTGDDADDAGGASDADADAGGDAASDADGAAAASDGGAADGGAAAGGATAASVEADADDESGDDEPGEGERVEFTGTVVQAGDPVILDNGEETMTVATDASVTLGEQVTARGTLRDGHVDADELV